jgi:hypothetical protein
MGNQFVLTRYVLCSLFDSHKYEGHLEMIWTCLICSNFIIFRLGIKQLLAQHIPLLLGSILLPSPSELQDGFTEPFVRGAVMQLVDTCLCSFLSTVDVPYLVGTQCCVQVLSLQKCR